MAPAVKALKRLVRFIVPAAIIIAAFAVFWKPLILWKIFSILIGRMSPVININPWLVRAICVPLALIVYWILANGLSLKKLHRKRAIAIAATVLCAYFLTAYVVQSASPAYFGPNGEPRMWYCETPSGDISMSPRPGIHPRYGDVYQPVTKDIVLRYEQQKKERAIRRRQEKRERMEQEELARAERRRARCLSCHRPSEIENPDGSLRNPRERRRRGWR